MKKFQHLINTRNESMIKVKRVWSVINAIRKATINCNTLNWQESSSRMPIRHLWGRCILKEKINAHKRPHRCKMKGINWCGTESEYNVPSISAEEIKMEKYQNHFEHWNRDECHLSAFCYEVEIEAYKEYKIVIIWMNQ